MKELNDYVVCFAPAVKENSIDNDSPGGFNETTLFIPIVRDC